MDFIIDDTDLPCTASGLGGVIVPESLEIVEICQDPVNIGIIYIFATIHGVYDYTPTLTVAYSKGDINVDGKYIKNYKGEGAAFPVSTKCGSKTVLLAYDIASLIPTYSTEKSLTFKLTFNGSSEGISDNDFVQEIFQSTNPSTEKVFTKGLSPVPYKVYVDSISGKFKVQFANLGKKPCLCAINCAAPEQEDLEIAVCVDEVQELTVDSNTIAGDPTQVSFTFVDSIGNSSLYEANIVAGFTPLKPQAFSASDPLHIRVTIHNVSNSGSKIDKSKLQYQIWRYEGTSSGAKIWKDWSPYNITSFVDTDVKMNKTYGYAVRFMGEFQEVSNLSAWSSTTL
jgi:hypothetical protein